jgi:hypothetical protein
LPRPATSKDDPLAEVIASAWPLRIIPADHRGVPAHGA